VIKAEQFKKLKVEAGKFLYSTLEPNLSIKVNDDFIAIIKSVVTHSVLVFYCLKKDGILSVNSNRKW
jgi:hypothetical protein